MCAPEIIPPPYKDTGHIECSGHYNRLWSHLNLIPSEMTPFKIRSPSRIPDGCEFGGNTLQLTMGVSPREDNAEPHLEG